MNKTSYNNLYSLLNVIYLPINLDKSVEIYHMNAKQIFIVSSITTVLSVSIIYLLIPAIFWVLVIIFLIFSSGIVAVFQKKHAIERNFTVFGNIRFLLEKIRPEILKYFLETDTKGRPINRLLRALVYKRIKKVNDTAPLRTPLNVYDVGSRIVTSGLATPYNLKRAHNNRKTSMHQILNYSDIYRQVTLAKHLKPTAPNPH
jgi:hypothetical protein